MSPEKIFDLLSHLRPFQIQLEMKTKVQNWTKMSICHITINHKKIWNILLDALICPLQIINWHWISSTLHDVNACFTNHPSNVKNYSIGHKPQRSQPKKKKRCVRAQFWGQNLANATENGQLSKLQCFIDTQKFLSRVYNWSFAIISNKWYGNKTIVSHDLVGKDFLKNGTLVSKMTSGYAQGLQSSKRRANHNLPIAIH